MNRSNGIGPADRISSTIRLFRFIGYGGSYEYGVFIFPTDTSIRPYVLAKEAEDRGFESFWVPEHSHIPISRKTPWGSVKDAAPLAEQYWRTHDQFVTLAFAAAATSTIKIGTGITLMAQRDPIWTAKEVATLDVLSGGRLEFGVGYGWNKKEMAQHGTAYLDRRALLREKVLMMKALWTEDKSAYQGEHVSLEPSWAWPKPAQRPHPPVIMGAAAGPKTLADMVESCDGWLPNGQRHDISGQVDKVRQAVSDTGRDGTAFEINASRTRFETSTLCATRVWTAPYSPCHPSGQRLCSPNSTPFSARLDWLDQAVRVHR